MKYLMLNRLHATFRDHSPYGSEIIRFGTFIPFPMQNKSSLNHGYQNFYGYEFYSCLLFRLYKTFFYEYLIIACIEKMFSQFYKSSQCKHYINIVEIQCKLLELPSFLNWVEKSYFFMKNKFKSLKKFLFLQNT